MSFVSGPRTDTGTWFSYTWTWFSYTLSVWCITNTRRADVLGSFQTGSFGSLTVCRNLIGISGFNHDRIVQIHEDSKELSAGQQQANENCTRIEMPRAFICMFVCLFVCKVAIKPKASHIFLNIKKKLKLHSHGVASTTGDWRFLKSMRSLLLMC